MTHQPDFHYIHRQKPSRLMRFLPQEYETLRQIAESFGLSMDQFRSVKQKGKLHIYYAQHSEPFTFFRFSETRLVEGKWVERELYRIYPNGKATVVEDWEMVRFELADWLKSLLNR